MTLPYDELNLVITEDVAIVVKYPAEQGPTGPTGVSGTAGPAGADGATILSGSGVPSSALGEDGDFYIDSDTGIFYKKAGGAWAIELEDIWTAHPTSSGTSHSDVVLNNAHRIATDNPHSVTATQTSVTDTEDYYTGTNVESILSEIGETRIISGYDRTGVYPMPSLSFTPGTRTFHVEVAIAESEFVFWSYSKKYTKTTTNNIVIPNTTGTYYIYFDGDGVLQYVEESSITGVIFYYMAITGIVYWNATVGNGIAGDERHGKLMDGMTHIYNHNTYGARYESGMDVTGLVDGSPTYTSTGVGYFWDEDIRHTVNLQSTHTFVYRDGADGAWRETSADNNVGYDNGTANTVWNEWTGATWQLTESAPSTDFIIYFFMATPDLSGNQVKKVIGQGAYATAGLARNAIEDELRSITTNGLPSQEFIFLYAYIVRRDGDLEELSDGSTYLDLRAIKGGAGGSSGSSTSPLTTKGDLYTYDTADTRLPIGTNGTVLTVDTTEATGLKWTAVSGTGSYTDEQAQDAVGNIMSGAGTVTVTYDDGTPSITISGSGSSVVGASHSDLDDLDYASAGHTGFQPAGSYATTTQLSTTSGTLQDNIDLKMTDLSDDTSPTLGGDLDTDGNAIVASDHGTATTAQVVNVVYGTGSAPTASGTTEGTIFIKYTA